MIHEKTGCQGEKTRERQQLADREGDPWPKAGRHWPEFAASDLPSFIRLDRWPAPRRRAFLPPPRLPVGDVRHDGPAVACSEPINCGRTNETRRILGQVRADC